MSHKISSLRKLLILHKKNIFATLLNLDPLGSDITRRTDQDPVDQKSPVNLIFIYVGIYGRHKNTIILILNNHIQQFF